MPDLPLELRDDTIRAALDHGDAAYLSQTITDFVRYQATWWIVYGDRWLRVTDDELATLLDRAATRMAAADTAVARATAPPARTNSQTRTQDTGDGTGEERR